MEINKELFDQMVSALRDARETLAYVVGELPDGDDAAELALSSVTSAIEAAEKGGK